MPDRKKAKLVRRLAAASIAVAVIVMAIKFGAWWLTGSVALYSDALESIVNVIAATTAFAAITLCAASRRTPTIRSAITRRNTCRPCWRAC